MAEAAKEAGLSFSQLSKLETAVGSLGMDSLVRLSDFYCVDRHWLLTGQGEHVRDQAVTSGERPAHAPAAAASPPADNDCIERVCALVCAPETMAKANAIAETLACSLAEALAVVVRRELKNGR